MLPFLRPLPVGKRARCTPTPPHQALHCIKAPSRWAGFGHPTAKDRPPICLARLEFESENLVALETLGVPLRNAFRVPFEPSKRRWSGERRRRTLKEQGTLEEPASAVLLKPRNRNFK